MIPRSPLIALAVLTLCVACQTPVPSPPDPLSPCPTPPPPAPVIEGEPPFITDRQALSQDRYFDLILTHGNLADLRSLLGRATAPEHAGAASARNIDRLRRAIRLRAQATCPDTPRYDPYRHFNIIMPLP